MQAPGGGDDSWGGPPPPSGGGRNEPSETRLGYQLAAFKDLTNQRLEELTREMRSGFTSIGTTIASQQYVTRERYDTEIEALRTAQKELRGTISRLWWLLGGTVVAAIAAALVNAAIVRGGP